MRGVVAALILTAASTGHHVDSGVTGVVTLGPTCPVERPGHPNCRDRAYATTLKVVRAREEEGERMHGGWRKCCWRIGHVRGLVWLFFIYCLFYRYKYCQVICVYI